MNGEVLLDDGRSYPRLSVLSTVLLMKSSHLPNIFKNVSTVVTANTTVSINIGYVHSGILGHMNDAQSFNSLPDISPKTGLPFPRETLILGDKIYPCRYPLITGFTAAQISTQPPLERERRLVFN